MLEMKPVLDHVKKQAEGFSAQVEAIGDGQTFS